MDGVIMRKIIRNVMLCLLSAAFFFLGGILANPDLPSREPERQIWDTPAESLRAAVRDVLDFQSARIYLRENLDGVFRAVDQTLEELGYNDRAAVTRSWKEFCTQKAQELSSSAVMTKVFAGYRGIGVFLREKLADFMAEE